MPTLYLFAISHFCEKARWALDYSGIAYELAYLAPGAHAQWAQAQGLAGSSLPILHTGDEYIQGSSTIIDWAEAHATNGKQLTPTSHRQEVLAIESRCDEILAVHTRRMFYSEALVEHPEIVKPVFLNDLAPQERETTEEIWPILREAMISRMDLGKEQGEASRQILESELDWLDGLYADGRRFLCGDAFSRADLAVSSFLAISATVPEHPAAELVTLPPRAMLVAERWKSRPTLVRVADNYREYR